MADLGCSNRCTECYIQRFFCYFVSCKCICESSSLEKAKKIVLVSYPENEIVLVVDRLQSYRKMNRPTTVLVSVRKSWSNTSFVRKTQSSDSGPTGKATLQPISTPVNLGTLFCSTCTYIMYSWCKPATNVTSLHGTNLSDFLPKCVWKVLELHWPTFELNHTTRSASNGPIGPICDSLKVHKYTKIK